MLPHLTMMLPTLGYLLVVLLLNQSITSASNTVLSTIPIGQLEDGSFYANISVGSPPQVFRMLINTGSWKSWIYSINIKKPESCGPNWTGYDPTISSTYKTSGSRYSMETGLGAQLIGTVGEDQLRIGDTHLQDLHFTTVDACFGERLATRMDGVLGIGKKRSKEITTDLEMHEHMGNRSGPLFVVHFYNETTEVVTSDSIGELTVSRNVSQESIVYEEPDYVVYDQLNVEQDKWQFLTTNFRIEHPFGGRSRFNLQQPLQTILDSSLTYSVVHVDVARILNERIGAIGGYNPPEIPHEPGATNCSLEGKPTITFSSNQEAEFVLEPADYILRIEDDSQEAGFRCVSAFKATLVDEVIIFGRNSMRKFSTIYVA